MSICQMSWSQIYIRQSKFYSHYIFFVDKMAATKRPATKVPATKVPATKSPATKKPATKSPRRKGRRRKVRRRKVRDQMAGDEKSGDEKSGTKWPATKSPLLKVHDQNSRGRKVRRPNGWRRTGLRPNLGLRREFYFKRHLPNFQIHPLCQMSANLIKMISHLNKVFVVLLMEI